MKKLVLILLPIFAFILLACSGETEETIEEIALDTTTKVEQEKVKPEVEYTVLERKDISYALSKRFTYRVLVPSDITQEEIKKVTEYLILEEKNKEPFNELSIFFYDKEEDASGSYTIAMVDYAPEGNWGEGQEVDTGDYSTHRAVYSFRER